MNGHTLLHPQSLCSRTLSYHRYQEGATELMTGDHDVQCTILYMNAHMHCTQCFDTWGVLLSESASLSVCLYTFQEGSEIHIHTKQYSSVLYLLSYLRVSERKCL